MKILIVEDEPSLRELMQRTLEKERYVVEVAATYGQALQKIEDYSYDCILLDIMLPDGSGLDLLDRFKALRKQGNVIIISAKDSIEDKVSGLDLGADDYLAKPFHLAELSARIKSVMCLCFVKSMIYCIILFFVPVIWSINRYWRKPYGAIISIRRIISISYMRR